LELPVYIPHIHLGHVVNGDQLSATHSLAIWIEPSASADQVPDSTDTLGWPINKAILGLAVTARKSLSFDFLIARRWDCEWRLLHFVDFY
jgi:hypothetical protein